jgi:hypothetical protein
MAVGTSQQGASFSPITLESLHLRFSSCVCVPTYIYVEGRRYEVVGAADKLGRVHCSSGKLL